MIQGVYETAPKHARQLLRNRIYTTENPTELCFGAIKVSAKRMTWGIQPQPHPLLIPQTLIEVSPSNSPSLFSSAQQLDLELTLPMGHEIQFLNYAEQLASSIPRQGPLYSCDRDVAALLVSKSGKILSWALNTNSLNRTLHAELNLIQDYYAQTNSPIPAGSKIFVTLKPCKMCAGVIWTCSEDPLSIQVYYSQFDPGRNARSTILDPGSAERRRNCSDPEKIQTILEHHMKTSLNQSKRGESFEDPPSS